VSKAFFDQIDDELRGLVGPALRDFRSLRTSRLVKVWFADPAVHYEAQRLSPRWAPDPASRYEVGLHLEHADARRNDGILGALTGKKAWRRALPAAAGAAAIGPQAATWRRLSELVEGEDGEDPDLAGEIAERLARYVRTLEPLLRRLTSTNGPRRETTLPAPRPRTARPPP
jgi:hypothetical protein